MKHLTSLGQMWLKYLPLAKFADKTFNIPNLANYRPYELVFAKAKATFKLRNIGWY